MKLFLKIAGALVITLVVAAVAVPMLVDVNQYKPQIQAAAESQTGRKLSIPGAISLSVFPWISIEIGELSLGNAEGFPEEHMLKVDGVSAALKLLPLLRGVIEVGTVTVDGLNLHLQIDKSGRSNWEDLLQDGGDAPQSTPESAKTGDKSRDLEISAIGGLEITDAAVSYIDEQSGARYRVNDFNFRTGPLHPGKAADISLSLRTESGEPKLKIDLSATSTLTLDLAAGTAQAQDLTLEINELAARGEISATSLRDTPRWEGRLDIAKFNLKQLLDSLGPGAPETADPDALTAVSGTASIAGTDNSATISDLIFRVDETTLKGSASIEDFATMKVRFDLNIDDLDADRYTAPTATNDTATAKGGDRTDETADINATPVDLSALQGLDVRGAARLGRLKLSDFELTDITTTVTIGNGKASLNPMGLALYGGKLTGSVVANSGGGQSLTIKQTLHNLQFEPLTTAATGERKLAGVGNLTLDLTTGGKTVGDLRQRLNGSIALDVKDGIVYGFDIGRMINAGRAKLKGESGTAALLANNAPDGEQKTEFDSLAATARIVNGLLTNNDLLLTSPDFRVVGKGTVHLYTEVLNYDADVTVLKTRKTEENQDLQDLNGTTVPFEVRGTVDDPKVRISFRKVAEEKAKAKVEEKKEEIREKAREKIFNKLFQ